MKRLDDITNLKNEVAGLQQEIRKLDVLIDKAHCMLGADEFLEEELNSKIRETLLWVDVAQNKIKAAYTEYKLGELPQNVGVALDCLTIMCDKLSKEKLSAKALKFMESLKAKKPEADVLLDPDREFLKDVVIEKLQADNELDKLEKYIDLLLSFEEEDRQKRFFKVVPALAHKFDNILLYEICDSLENFEFVIPEDEEFTVKAISIGAETLPSAVSAEKETATAVVLAQANTIADKTLEPTTIETVKEILPAHESDVTAVTENKTDKTGSQESTPEPVVALGEEIKIQSEEEIVVKETKNFKDAFVDQDKDAVSLRSGSKKDIGSYTINKFKIQSKGWEDKLYRKIFSNIDGNGYFRAASLDCPKEEKEALIILADRQMCLGYLDRIDIKGFGSFYVAGNIGNSALKDPAFRRIVGLGKAKKRADIPMFSKHNPYNVFSFIKSREYVLNNSEGKLVAEQELVENNTFSSIVCNSADQNSNIVIVGVTSFKKDDVNKLKNSLSKLNEGSSLVVAGLDLAKARGISEWVLETLPDNIKQSLTDERVIYYSVVEDKGENKLGEAVTSFTGYSEMTEITEDITKETVVATTEVPTNEGVNAETNDVLEEKPAENIIDVPEECLIKINKLQSNSIIYEDKEKKAITPKEFKKNLGSDPMCRFILRNLVVNGYISAEAVANFFDKTVEGCEFSIGLCHKAGLLRKYEYKDHGSYYVLSPKGSSLCNNGSMISFLDLKSDRGPDIQRRYEKITEPNAIAFVDCETYLHKMLNMGRSSWSSEIGDEFFAYRVVYPSAGGDNGYFALGCFTESKEEFAKFAAAMKKDVDKPYLFICVGWNKEQAHNVAEWFSQNFDKYASNSILYKAIGSDTVYDMDGDQYEKLTDATLAIAQKLDTKVAKLKEDSSENHKASLLQQVSGSSNKAEIEVAKDNELAKGEPDKKKKNIKNKPVTVEPQDGEEEQPEVVSDNFVLTNPSVEGYIDNFNKMLAKDKIYAACGYLKALSEKDKNFYSLYKQLAYATGDPLGGCSFTSNVVSDVFYGSEDYDEQLLVSAALRTFFFDYFSYDYHISELQSAVLNSKLVDSVKPLGTLVKEIGDFKNQYNCGLDYYADYHQNSNSDIDKRMAELRVYTKEQFDHYIMSFKEDISNKRFSEARKLFLDKNGEVAKLLRYVINGDESKDALDEIKTYLKDKVVKDGALIREENIDSQKIDDIIEDTWLKAADRINCSIRSSDLMSALRTKYYNQIDRLVKPLCNYIALIEAKVPVDNPAASLTYKKLRSKLLKSITDSLEGLRTYEEMGVNTVKVLEKTLAEIESRINGSYKIGSEKYFYLDFLKTDNILLNEQYLPYFQDVDENLPSMSPLRRIEKHLSIGEVSLEKRAQAILDNEDNFASLECILQYLDTVNDGYSNKFRKDKALKLSMENAAKGLDFLREEFDNDIELRQSYGQIDETEGNRKEELTSFIDCWYEWAKETHNYGFFRKVCEAYIERIEQEALPRGIALSKKLADFKEKHPERLGEDIVEEAVRTIEERIRIKNFTAAEDLLNRLEKDELMVVKDVVEFDYLSSFISNYTSLYQDVFNMRSNLKDTLMKRVPHNKEEKAAARIVEGWIPSPEYCSPERVKELLESLDFPVGVVCARYKMGSAYVYDVTLARPADGRKVKYKHPIAAFGSVAESEAFRVAFVFGNFETQGLLEISNTLGDAQDTLLFVDGALTLSTRRNLARKTKETTKKIFAVVDRVVLAYLVRYYKPAAIQKMLMNLIIPFAYCQPYVADSVNVMPPEMFMGREEELAQIESPNGVNIVYGGRQLGKSAMLRMAQNHIDKNERGDRAVFVDIIGLDYAKACRKVSVVLEEEGILKEGAITSDWDELAHSLRVRLKSNENRIPYLLLLLDEADAFVASCAEVGYRPLEALKDVQGVGVGRFKFVFAGLRDVIRFDHNQALGNNSVLTKLAKLTVRPFDVNEARTLLEKPLSYLGFRFAKDKETESLIASIFSSTNYFPGLLQLYCTNLIKALQKPDYAGYDEVDTPTYEVSVQHIKKVLGGTELQKQIREKFYITLQLDEKDDNFYYTIALLVALQHHKDAENSDVTPEMLLALADQYGVNKVSTLDEQKAYALMEELCELNVLHNSGKGYRFTRYSFYQMMGTEKHIEDELLKLMEG